MGYFILINVGLLPVCGYLLANPKNLEVKIFATIGLVANFVAIVIHILNV